MFGLKKKKYLEWYSNEGGGAVTEETINEFLDPAAIKGSCWWSSLSKRIDNSFSSPKEYIQSRHKEHDTNLSSLGPTVKQCPAVNSIISNSFLIKSPTDVVVTVFSDSTFCYNSANSLMRLGTHPTDQFHTAKNNIFVGKMNLKLELPIYLRTDNIPWLILQPMYHNNIWFDVASGSIEKKYTKGQPLVINVIVDIPKGEPVTYEIKAGDVLGYLWLPEDVELKHTEKEFYRTLYKRKWSSRSRF